MGKQSAEIRVETILCAAIKLSKKHGYMRVTRDDIAREAECSTGTVSRYFNTMSQLRRRLMRKAIKDGELVIIAQGLLNRERSAMRLDSEVKQAAFKSLTE